MFGDLSEEVLQSTASAIHETSRVAVELRQHFLSRQWLQKGTVLLYSTWVSHFAGKLYTRV